MDEILQTLNALQIAVITTSVIGVVELIKRLSTKDITGATTIVISALVGLLMGLPVGAPWYLGLILGMSASGLITGLSRMATTTTTNNTTVTKVQGNKATVSKGTNKK